MDTSNITNNILPRGLIISCQAVEGEPLYKCNIMHLMARCAKEGGAKAIRALAEDIKAIRRETGLPIIGLIKKCYGDSSVYITPTLAEVRQLLQEDCQIIALDATSRPRPQGAKLADLVQYVRTHAPHVALLADIATLDEAVNAQELGFEYVSTTLRGYTEDTQDCQIPDMSFIEQCSSALTKSALVVEGGIWDVNQLTQILRYNPYAVVIGTAVTRPRDITARFASVFKQ